jgi:flagellar hook-basal body complex protein FliE
MNIVDNAVRGHIVNMRTANPLHFQDTQGAAREADDVAGSFIDMLKGAIGKVNDLQVQSDELTQKMIYQPESVDIHQVMIAGQKAEISLSFAKAIRDEAIRTYRELINLR